MPRLQLLRLLSERAANGSQPSLVRLHEVLDEDPSIWQALGDLGAIAERKWAKRIADSDVLVTETILRRLQEWKAGLAGDSPSPLEKALVDVLGVCWLDLQDANIVHANVVRQSPVPRSALRRVESALKCFTQTAKALTTIRTHAVFQRRKNSPPRAVSSVDE